MLNPLAGGDDSKLNIEQVDKQYQKNQVFQDSPEDGRRRPLSPLLDIKEKNSAWNAGQSCDSKKVTSALGYLDLKQICYCLAQALNKHIEFSKGYYFLDELIAANEAGED